MRAILLTLFAVSAFGATLAPYGLEVEARRDPLGVDERQPRLSWKLRSSARAQRQAAWQVLVASAPERLVPGRADLWDSGRIAGDRTAWVPYAGAALRSFQRCFWKVGVWNGEEAAPAWSEPAQWTAGVLDRKDRKGGWIAHPHGSLRAGPMPIFRTEFRLDRAPVRALAAISGVGFHELRINGAKAGDHELAPAWTNYRNTVLYELLDVTSMLKPGPNAVGILLGNGFYNVVGGRYTKYTGSFGQPRAHLQLHVEFEDGSSRDFYTDSSWRVQDGPITFSCIYGGEDYDARREPPGWDLPGFDDKGWLQAAGVESAGGTQRAQSSPPARVLETFRPVKITEPKPGVFVYDLGQNFGGRPRIEVSGPAGAQVRLTPGELLDAAGLVSQRSSGGPTSFLYTLRGDGREAWAPRFTYYGFRYVQVEGATPEKSPQAGAPVLHTLEGQFVHLDAPRAGSFRCDNDLLNRIHALIDAAVRSNLQHVLTDCPHREKLGWIEQTYLMGPSLFYNWDLRSFLPKIVRDMREAQTADGLVPGIAPEYPVFGWSEIGFRDSPEWGSASILVPWLAWQWYGDRRPLEESYGAMKRYAGYLAAQSSERLLTYGLGDWYDIGPGGPGASKLTPKGLTATATYYADLRTLERTAALLGRPAEESEFAAQAGQVAAAFQKAFYHPDRPTYATGSQTALGMPLVLGLAPAGARDRLLAQLVADIRARGSHASAGDVGYSYVIRALMEGGRSDVLYDMATRTDAPSYGAQLAAGATSLTEAWDANPDSSQNHLMLGHIEQFFYGGLAGIQPDPEAPGARRIRIQPEVVGDLKSVQASWESPAGPVLVDWRRGPGGLVLKVEVPPGLTAEVGVPAGSADKVTEGGGPASGSRGVRFLRQAGGRVWLEVASGGYEFRAP